MNQFLTKLEVEQLEDTSNEGRGTWQLIAPLHYQSDEYGDLIVPAGFVTDFASVPRVPLVFDLLGDRGNLAATLHDWLYTAPHPIDNREKADLILFEALMAQGVSHFEAQALYEGVRLAGVSYWD